jgi:hypothetical protein
MAKIKDVKGFKKVLALGARQMRLGKGNVWSAAQFAVTHYSECGDHGPLNEVMVTLRNDIQLGVSAYANWVVKYTDQAWDAEASKFVRDEDSDVVTDADKAVTDNFWNNVKNEIVIEEFDGDAFYTEILKVVKRFENVDRKVAKDEASENTVVDMRKHITAKAPSVVLAA